MGDKIYADYAKALAKYDLGLELLVYGFAKTGQPNLFEVVNPGSISSHNLRGFAAIGSGSIMALAALNRKALPATIGPLIYRLLDAKFSSETAHDVGKKTFVITIDKAGKYGGMSQDYIEQIRAIWDRNLKAPEPADALELINKSGAVNLAS